MTALALAARNYLAQQPEVVALLGSDSLWSTWIFVDTPEVVVESTGKAMIVLSVVDGWAGANAHNTVTFPRLTVDIWVDPTRNSDHSVKLKDAKIRAGEIYKAIDRHLHQMKNSLPGGSAVIWGTAAQISNKTGVRVISSTREGEPSYRPAFDDQGAVLATVRYNVTT